MMMPHCQDARNYFTQDYACLSVHQRIKVRSVIWKKFHIGYVKSRLLWSGHVISLRSQMVLNYRTKWDHFNYIQLSNSSDNVCIRIYIFCRHGLSIVLCGGLYWRDNLGKKTHVNMAFSTIISKKLFYKTEEVNLFTDILVRNLLHNQRIQANLFPERSLY